MKSLLKLLFCGILVICFTIEGQAARVRSYRRKNGTVVRSHERRTRKSGRMIGSKAKVKKPSRETSSESRSFPYSMKKRKYDQQGGCCAHCGKHYPISQMDADHIVPYSKGGKTTWDNLQILCRHCNRSKGNRFIGLIISQIKLLMC